MTGDLFPYFLVNFGSDFFLFFNKILASRPEESLLDPGHLERHHGLEMYRPGMAGPCMTGLFTSSCFLKLLYVELHLYEIDSSKM